MMVSEMDKIAFICVNYNNAQITNEWVESILNCFEYDSSFVDIIIIDNNSRESEILLLKAMKGKYAQIDIIFSDRNVGYFGGLNIGIKFLENLNQYKYVIIGNNDITFAKNFITLLKNEQHEGNVYIIAPSVVTDEGRMQNPHIVDRVNPLDILKTRLYFSNYYLGQFIKIAYQPLKGLQKILKKKSNKQQYLERMVIKRGIGACYILTKEFLKFCRYLDDRVFLWGEEALLSHQVEENGGVTLYDPAFLVNHHESVSVSLIEQKKRYYMVRESYRIYKDYL
jgi:GT2 family glycosyltransferase